MSRKEGGGGLEAQTGDCVGVVLTGNAERS